jgi:hypothetical protein
MMELARAAKERKNAVAGMRAGFRNAHAEMAKISRAERVAFLSGLRRTVSAMRKRFTDDIAGARQAWFGPIPGELPVVELEVPKHEEVRTGAAEEHEVPKHEEAETGAGEEHEVYGFEEEEKESETIEEVFKSAEIETEEERQVTGVFTPPKIKPKGKKR